MKPNTSLVAILLTLVVPSCATPFRASIAEPAEPLQTVGASKPAQDPTIDTVRARRIEIVDASGRPRITIGDRGLGTSSIQFLNSGGDVVWSATHIEQAKGAKDRLPVGDAIVLHGSAGESGALYNLLVSAHGCAFYMGSESDTDEGAIGIQYSNGEAILSLAAKHAAEGEVGNAQVSMALVKDRIVIRDMSGKELTSFAAPLYDDEKK